MYCVKKYLNKIRRYIPTPIKTNKRPKMVTWYYFFLQHVQAIRTKIKWENQNNRYKEIIHSEPNSQRERSAVQLETSNKINIKSIKKRTSVKVIHLPNNNIRGPLCNSRVHNMTTTRGVKSRKQPLQWKGFHNF